MSRAQKEFERRQSIRRVNAFGRDDHSVWHRLSDLVPVSTSMVTHCKQKLPTTGCVVGLTTRELATLDGELCIECFQGQAA